MRGTSGGETGEVEVVGRGEITVPVRHKPKHIVVRFVGEPKITPCNPIQFDELTWVFNERQRRERHMHHHDLEISFIVYGSPRIIEWIITY